MSGRAFPRGRTARWRPGRGWSFSAVRERSGWGPGRGMAALCLCREGQAGDMFYLDKPVALKPGTEFALLPLEEGSAVRLAADRPLERAGSLPTAEPGLIRPTIRVERILTLFYQEKEPGFFFPGERHRPYELIYVDHGRAPQRGRRAGLRAGAEPGADRAAGPVAHAVRRGGGAGGLYHRLLHLRRAAAGGDPAAGAGPGPDGAGAGPGAGGGGGEGTAYRGDLLVAVLQAMLALWARRAAGGGGEAVAAPATRRGECRILDQAIQYVAESTATG